MTSAEKLNNLLAENNGYLKTSDAVAAGVSRTVLGDYVRQYGLERVAHGLYMSQDAWEDGLYVIQVRYPEAVFSHETALYLLNLANREPSLFSVTLKTGTNSSGLSKQGIKVYKVKEELSAKVLWRCVHRRVTQYGLIMPSGQSVIYFAAAGILKFKICKRELKHISV